MKSFTAVSISNSSSLDPRTSSDYHDFYEFLFREFNSAEGSSDHVILDPVYLTKRQTAFSPPAAKEIKGAFDESEFIIFDFYNFGRPFELNYAIVEELTQIITESPTTQVLFLTKFYSPTDHLADALHDKIEGGRLHILDRMGRLVSSLHDTARFQQSKFSHLLEALEEDNITRIKTRTIRHIGHYKKFGDDEALECSRFFFDGSNVVNEIVSEISERLSDTFFDSSIRSVITVAPSGNWLHQVGKGLSDVFENAHIPVKDANQFVKQAASNVAGSLVLFAMCDTGDSIRKFILSLPPENGIDDKTNFFAVYSTNGIDETRGKIHLSVDAELGIEVGYLQKVKQKTVPSTKCRYCSSGIKDYSTDTDYLKNDKLPAEVFWTLAFEAGFAVERDVPEYRRQSLGFIPDFQNMSLINGQFIAHKILKKLSSIPGNLPPEPFVLCPEEAGALELARNLSRIGNCNSLFVPRKVIRKFEVSVLTEAEMAEQGYDTEYWYKQITNLSTNPMPIRPILFDEFDVSGSTFVGLNNLLLSLGMEAWCGVTLASFRLVETEISGIELYNCYHIGVM